MFAASSLIAQQDTGAHSNIIVPVPVEGLGGNKRFVLSTLVKKPFTPASKFSLLSVTNAASSYKNDLQDFDFINVTQVSYNLYKGVGVTAGISLNNVPGFNPTAGILQKDQKDWIYLKNFTIASKSFIKTFEFCNAFPTETAL